jgi:hypothetical protein
MLVSLATTPAQVQAEEPDASSLQKEVEELRQEVQSLKQQVKSLQEAPAPAPPPQPVAKEPAPAPPPQAQPAPNASPASVPATAKPAADSIVALRESWRHVDRGMTQAEITGLLGPPTKQLKIDGKLVWYYYYAGIGGASVFFNGDGRVSSSQRPTVGWW